MQTLKIDDPSALSAALATLQAGGLVICPTETVYGLLADATNPQAVAKLLAFKRRPAGKAISIAVADKAMAEKYVDLNHQAHQLYQQFLPGPVTVISHSRHQVDSRLESEFGTIGIRWSSYSFLTNLITKFSRPVTATSANASGKKTPYALADIFAHLSGKQQALIDLVLDAGTLPKNPPSLVIDTTTSTPIVMRPNHQTKISLPENAPTYRTHFDEETRALAGKILLSHLDNLTTHPLTITLDGELGAGKTTFTQGLAQFLGITDIVNSPTYTYQKEYPYQKFDHQGTLYHLDVWTLDRPEMLQALELEKLAQPNNLIVIEWYHTIASFFTPSLPWLEIALQPDTKKPNDRLITLTPHLENSPSASTASFQVTASTQKVPKKYPSSTQKVTASNSKNKKVSKI